MVEAKEEVIEPTMEEWVMAEIKKAKIDEKKAYAIISCESKWNESAYNINKNKTIDAGIWQINSIHYNKDFTIKDALDYKKATHWAIAKIEKQGFEPWVCADILGF